VQTATFAALVLLTTAQLAAGSARAEGAKPTGIEHGITKPWLGDFDGMLERRRIRWLVVPSRTFYFVDKGTQRGLSYDHGKAFEDEVNRKLKKKTLRVEVVFVPVRPDDLLPALLQGRGDVAAANLTITPERQQFVDFSAPLWTGVDEIVVTGPTSPKIASVDGLAGREIFVRLSSSYFVFAPDVSQCQGVELIRSRHSRSTSPVFKLPNYNSAGRSVHLSRKTLTTVVSRRAKPAYLPIEQPTKFALVINLRTPRTSGSRSRRLVRADEVIQ